MPRNFVPGVERSNRNLAALTVVLELPRDVEPDDDDGCEAGQQQPSDGGVRKAPEERDMCRF